MRRVFLSAIIGILLLTLPLASGCLGGVGSGESPTTTAGITKPKPVVESVTAASSGMGENYYAILDITVKNEGAEGTVLVTGSITQGGKTSTNEVIVSLKRSENQVVRLVVPIKWEGGEWTPGARVLVP